MKTSGISSKFKELKSLIFEENKFKLKSIKLLFNALYYSTFSWIKKERNTASEIYSYESLFLIKKEDPMGFLESCRKNPAAFAPGIRDEVIKLKTTFNVDILETLEIGSGPNSNLSYWVDNKLISVTAIDPLADIYKKIMKKLDYRYPIIPIKMKGEDLLKNFEKESFHIIFAQNSLDHAEDPLKCFKSGYTLLKKGGLMFVCTNIREGSRKNWAGMHKFDIFMKNNELCLGNQFGKIYNLIDKSTMSLDLIFYEEYFKNNVPSFEAVYRKL